MHELYHVLIHTFKDTVGLVPFLFLTYLAMEYMEHKTAGKIQDVIKRAGKVGPLFGGLLGAVPQCGFSAAASGFYAGRVITLGTLIAVYLSTSDEMLPILLSEADTIGIPAILKIVCLKAFIGILVGFIIDLLMKPKHEEHEHIHEICEHDHCHCGEGSSVFKSALVHTGQVTLFIVAITFVLNLLLEFGGETVLESLVLNKPIIGPILAGLVGLIPNCASSVVLTRLYVEGAMSFAACMSGLLVNAGVGILVLFRANHDKKENIKIVAMLYIIGIVVGILLQAFGVTV